MHFISKVSSIMREKIDTNLTEYSQHFLLFCNFFFLYEFADMCTRACMCSTTRHI